MSKTVISIIGSAGRTNDAKIMSKERFNGMVSLLDEIITEIYDWKFVILQSGGAAWSDHVAVVLALKYGCETRLYLPCKWVNGAHEDNGSSDWRTNPGRIANKYHKEFSKKMGINTLDQTKLFDLKGATLESFNGFHSRNSKVAQCNVLFAFTSSLDESPKDGGTADTWKKCKSLNKHHISLLSIK